MNNGIVSIKPKDFSQSPFALINQDWLLLSAEKDGVTNGMTCSWGGIGVLWRKNVAFIFVRHQRYTYEFMEAADTFSLSFFDDPNHELLTYFGKTSGRDEDKISKAGLTLEKRLETPCYKEAKLTFICKKLYSQDQDLSLFEDNHIVDDCYPNGDIHKMYIGEILDIQAIEI